MNLFLSTLKFKGFPIDKALETLRGVQSLNGEQFAKYQENKKWEIFRHHYYNNPFYKQWVEQHGGNKITSWDQIPVLTKKDLQKPIEERLTPGVNKKHIHIHSTSGSTGTPFFFAKDKFCHAMTWAIIIDRYGRHGIEYGKSKQARFYGIPLGFVKNKLERFKDKLSNRVRFPVFDLSDHVLEKYYKVFEKQKFDYINGYTSSLVLFAKFLIKRRIVLKTVCPTLKVTFPTSEICSPEDRNLLEAAFGVPVANEYGAAELDIIALEDKSFDWILNEENLFIEILDEQGVPCKPEKEGRIVITSLYNRAMPFIRYEIGDVGSLAGNTKGKYRLLKSLIGRTNDVAILPSGKKSPGLTFYYISKKLLESGGFMKEFIIKQTAIDSFHFEYSAEREITDGEKEAVQKAMDTYLEPGLKPTFERKSEIQRTKAGKLKHFHSLMK